MQEIVSYLKEKESLFTVIGFLIAITALLPLLITFIFGENWTEIFFSTKYGYLTFLFCLIITFLVGIFIIYISISLSIDFIKDKICNAPISPKIFLQLLAFLLIPICLIILSIILMSFWSLINNFFIILPSLSFIFLFYMAGIIILLFVSLNTGLQGINFKDPSLPYVIQILITGFFFLIFIYPNIPILYTENTKIFDYYDTQPTIELNYSLNYLKENNLNLGPETLSMYMFLNESIPQNKISDIQQNFAKCKWSTNYGHFIVYDTTNSILINQNQDFIYRCCNNCNNLIYWTYDYSDFDKPKPDVYVIMKIEDKNTKRVLGHSELNFTWKNNTLIPKRL